MKFPMVKEKRNSGPIRVGALELFPAFNEIRNGNRSYALRSGIMQLLLYLLAHRNQVVTKEDILANVWPDRVVSIGSVARSVSELRQFLSHHFAGIVEIETIPKVGYRLRIQEAPPKPKSPAVKRPWWPLIVLFLPLVIWGFYVFTIGGEQKVEAPTKISYLTAYQGREMQPALSPDGENLLFSWQKGAGEVPKIFVRETGGSVPRQLTFGSGHDLQPRWLPGESAVVFLRVLPEGGSKIIKKSLISQDETMLVSVPFQVVDRRYDLTNDGSAFYVSARSDSNSTYSLYQYLRKTGQWEAVRERQTADFNDQYPIYLNRDYQLAFIRTELDPKEGAFKQLMVSDLASGKLKTLYRFKDYVAGLTWQATKNRFLIWLRRNYSNRLIAVDLTGATQVIKSNVLTMPGAIYAAPESDQIVYEIWEGNTSIHRLDLLGERPFSMELEAIFPSSKSDRSMAISGDGKSAAFISTRTGAMDVWWAELANPLTLRKITNNQNNAKVLKWVALSGAGHWLAYSYREGLTIVDRLGVLVDSLHFPAAEVLAPAWSPSQEGRLFFSVRTKDDFYLYGYDLERKDLYQLAVSDGVRPIPRLANGSEVIYYYHTLDGSIRKWDLEAEKQVEVLAGHFEADPFNWQPSEEGLYFLTKKKGEPRICFFNFASGQTSDVFPATNVLSGLPSIGLSPDGSSLYLTRSEAVNVDLVAERLE